MYKGHSESSQSRLAIFTASKIKKDQLQATFAVNPVYVLFKKKDTLFLSHSDHACGTPWAPTRAPRGGAPFFFLS